MPKAHEPPQPPRLPPGHLTPHFTLAEMIASDTADAEGIENLPDADEVDELGETALLLEKVRALCGGQPVLISSGFRCPELNAAVGGAANSAHLYGCAADFIIPDFGSPLDVCHAIEPHLNEWGVDQLIYEMTWVHIGRAIPPTTPRAQCLTINNGGTYNGIVA
jgi:zinc D-Ala-D-Ala carboxypeptidase